MKKAPKAEQNIEQAAAETKERAAASAADPKQDPKQEPKAEKHRLSEKMQSIREKRPSFALWASLFTAIVLILLCVVSVLTERENEAAEQGVIDLRIREYETVEFEVRVTPEPTAVPLVLPKDAVDVLIDESRVALTLGSEPEARTLLADYLNTCADAVTEGRVLSARFACTVHIVPAGGKSPALTYAEAMEALKADPKLVPVQLVTETRTVSVGEMKTETHKIDALAKDAKIYSQLGSGALTVTAKAGTYVAGELQGEAAAEENTLFDARTNIIKTGTYVDSNPKEDEPGKKEGPMGKSKEDLKLALPIRAQVSSYFGIRDDKMHNGIDLSAKAGTEIKAPGEGIVVYVGERAEYGTVIDIDHGSGFVSRLTHCQDVQVEVHQRVFLGDVVATLAPLTYGTGKPHLHYELLIDGIPHNPLYYFD